MISRSRHNRALYMSCFAFLPCKETYAPQSATRFVYSWGFDSLQRQALSCVSKTRINSISYISSRVGHVTTFHYHSVYLPIFSMCLSKPSPCITVKRKSAAMRFQKQQQQRASAKRGLDGTSNKLPLPFCIPPNVRLC